MQYIASISYGKDSLAMLEVIKQHNMQLDRIVHVEIMATDTIPADLPPMCNSDLKMPELKKLNKPDITQYIGIAADEPNRFHNITDRKRSPLVEHGVTEAEARQICEKLDLLSPIYTQAERGGCWFCHNQGVNQLWLLRKHYPKYWALMLKWDKDSPVTFKPNGMTVHDFEQRFQNEDAQINLFDY